MSNINIRFPNAPKLYDQPDQDQFRRAVERALQQGVTLGTTGGGSGSLQIKLDDVNFAGSVGVLDFVDADFNLTHSPAGELNIGLDGSVSRVGHTHDAADVVSGIFARARLPTQVAYEDEANTFALAQTFTLAAAFNAAGAPFTVASSTLVTNLNADLLDGQSGAFYQNASNLNAGNLAYARLPTGGGTWANGGALSITGGLVTVDDFRSNATVLIIRTGAEPILRVQRNLTNNPRWDIGRMASSSFRFIYADDITPEFQALAISSAAVLSGADTNSVTRWTLGPSGTSTGFELGRTDGVAASPFIDFHSGATAVDYDSRLLAQGGTGVSAGGTLIAIASTFAYHSTSGNARATFTDTLTTLATTTSVTGGKLLVDGTDSVLASGEMGLAENAGELWLGARSVVRLLMDDDATASGSVVILKGTQAAPTTLWTFDINGHIIAGTDNTQDLGASGATRPRTGYFGTSLVTPAIYAPAATALVLGGALANHWQITTGGNLAPLTDNAQDLGGSAVRVRDAYANRMFLGAPTSHVGAKLVIGDVGISTANVEATAGGRIDWTLWDTSAAADDRRVDIFSLNGVGGPGSLVIGETRTDAGAAGEALLQGFHSGTVWTGLNIHTSGTGTTTIGNSNGVYINSNPGGTESFRVNGTTRLAGATVISTGDLTLSTGRLVFSAASGKILMGATSITVRDSADAANIMALTAGGGLSLTGTVAELVLNARGGGGNPWELYVPTTASFRLYHAGDQYIFSDTEFTPSAAGGKTLGLTGTRWGKVWAQDADFSLDVKMDVLGTFDHTGTRFTSGTGPVADDVMSWHAGAGKWRPRFLQTNFTNGVVTAQNNTDGTFANFAFSVTYNNATPAVPSTPIVTPIYGGFIIDMGALPPAGSSYVVDYSINGGAFTTNRIIFTSQKMVHTVLTNNGGAAFSSSDTFSYKAKGRGKADGTFDSAYSAASSAASYLVTTEVNAFGLVLASQVSAVYLSAITANVGSITAGQLLAGDGTSVLQLDSTFSIPGTVTKGIFFASANPVGAGITGMYIDFTATGVRPLFHHANLDLLADGSFVGGTATFTGPVTAKQLNIQDAGAAGASAPVTVGIGTGTWNTSGSPIGLVVNADVTAAGAGARIFLVRRSGTEVFAVDQAGDTRTLNRTLLTAAAAKIVPGVTSLSLRNNADSADNLIILDAGDAAFRTFIEQSEIAAPATPAANKTRMYAKDLSGVSALYYKNDAGTEIPIGFTLIDTQTFTATGAGTWTKPAGAVWVVVEVVGGGGGGGGGAGNSAGSYRGGGGGGGGGARARVWFRAADLGSTEDFSVGVGGTAGSGGSTADGGTGGAGGDSWFGSATQSLAKAWAYGGGAGFGTSSTNQISGGGGGGSHSVGSVGAVAASSTGGEPHGGAGISGSGHGGAGSLFGAAGKPAAFGGASGAGRATSGGAGLDGGVGQWGGGGGASGGAVSAANVGGNGGVGGGNKTGVSGGGGAAGTGGSVATAGSAGAVGDHVRSGAGGGGGGGDTNSTGAVGGAGGAPGGGGGGGGGGTTTGGAGGVGGRGEVRVYSYA